MKIKRGGGGGVGIYLSQQKRPEGGALRTQPRGPFRRLGQQAVRQGNLGAKENNIPGRYVEHMRQREGGKRRHPRSQIPTPYVAVYILRSMYSSHNKRDARNKTKKKQKKTGLPRRRQRTPHSPRAERGMARFPLLRGKCIFSAAPETSRQTETPTRPAAGGGVDKQKHPPERRQGVPIDIDGSPGRRQGCRGSRRRGRSCPGRS